MGIVAGVITAGVLAAGATAYSASSASSAAQAANAQNAQNINSTNALNYQQFLQSRGSTGSAVYPIYGAGAEAQLYGDTLGTYDATGALQPTAQQLASITNAAIPYQQQANTAAAGIFNGATQGQELANQLPVYQAQLQAAQTQKQGTLEALQSTLNNIKAIQAGRGYSGDSFGNQLLNFQARQGANTAISNQISAANIGNAQTIQAIKQNAINRQLSNLSLPGQMAANNIALAQQPANALENQMGQRQALFNNFRIGTGQFQYQPLPLVSPTANTGQIAGQAIGSLGSSLGNYASNQQLVSQLAQSQNNNAWNIAGLLASSTTSPTWLPNAGTQVQEETPVTATDLTPTAVNKSLSGDF
jgi:hypothetical protein